MGYNSINIGRNCIGKRSTSTSRPIFIMDIRPLAIKGHLDKVKKLRVFLEIFDEKQLYCNVCTRISQSKYTSLLRHYLGV